VLSQQRSLGPLLTLKALRFGEGLCAENVPPPAFSFQSFIISRCFPPLSFKRLAETFTFLFAIPSVITVFVPDFLVILSGFLFVAVLFGAIGPLESVSIFVIRLVLISFTFS